MNIPEFIDLVAKMRHGQRAYTNDIVQARLAYGKPHGWEKQIMETLAIEKEVDAALRELRGGPGLFEEQHDTNTH